MNVLQNSTSKEVETTRKRRKNQCICELVSSNSTPSLCKDVEALLGEDHWLRGCMCQIPPVDAERHGINMRERWLFHLGVSEEDLQKKDIKKPEVLWTHFPETFFQKDDQNNSEKNESNIIASDEKKRRRLKYVIEPVFGILDKDLIVQGKYCGKAIPVPLVKLKPLADHLWMKKESQKSNSGENDTKGLIAIVGSLQETVRELTTQVSTLKESHSKLIEELRQIIGDKKRSLIDISSSGNTLQSFLSQQEPKKRKEN